MRAQAHHLDPVVSVGQHGLTPPVLHEIDLALLKHELIKVRVFSDDRTVRNAMLEQICTEMTCAPIQHLGKVLVLWRPNPDKKKKQVPVEAKTARKAAGRRGAVKKSGPRAPIDPVRERRRGVRDEAGAAATGKGRRGAARNAPAERGDDVPVPAPAARRKSTFTPKTKPRSFSAKPNPRSAWEKPPATGTPTRRRRTTG